jgi:DNA-directed RNA polymerase subunit RPC12/RpoP
MNTHSANPAQTALAVGYFVIWAIAGLGGWFYVNRRPTVPLRRLWWRRYVIGFGALVYAMMIVMLDANPQAPRRAVVAASLVLLPFFALITWLNLRNTYFCQACGARTRNANFFSKPYTHCPKCGAKFE